jgi:hypothetical protein
VARLEHAFKAFPDLADARPRTGARTYGRLRDMLAAELAVLSQDRAKLRSAGDEAVLARLRRSMRGMSRDQRRVVEQHLALPDRRRRRRRGGVCFVYRPRQPTQEELCFDRAGRRIDGS